MGDSLTFLIALGLATVLTPLCGWLGNAVRLVDWPIEDHLKIHTRPVPLSGGVAVLGSLLITLAVAGAWPRAGVAAGLVLAFLTGFVDDARPLSSRLRILLLTVAGVLLATGGVRLWPLGAVGAVGTVLLTVVCANAVNLMDGQDALVGGLGALAAAGLAFVMARHGGSTSSQLGYALGGSLLGFLVWNRPPAKIFLGNGGAYAVGVALAGLAAAVSVLDGLRGVFVSMVCLSPFAFELVVTVARRLSSKAALDEGDRLHSYDVLARGLGSRPKATVVLWSFGLVMAAVAYGLSFAPPTASIAVSAAVVLSAAAFGVYQGRGQSRMGVSLARVGNLDRASVGGGSLDGEPPEGALVISLDFELHWGVRDWCRPDSPYRANLLGAREAIPRMLDMFDEFQVAATWATVGLLFAESREELEMMSPAIRPAYRDHTLFPYEEPVGESERDDPLHYAPTLIRRIAECPRQEVGTHTFSHYYCLEPGQTGDAFRADLISARTIAERRGIRLRSIALPRNQINHSYAGILTEAAIKSFRGNQSAWMYRPRTEAQTGTLTRAGRFLDAYVPAGGLHLTQWCDVRQPNGLCNIPASIFLRPFTASRQWLEPLRRARILLSLSRAAVSRSILHIWWHPHNFGTETSENLEFLRTLLQSFAHYRDSYGMRSLSMGEVADEVERIAVVT